MKKKLWILLVLFAILGVIGYNYVYQDHRNISTESASYTVTASELINQFQENATVSQEKYLNKTIQITGTVTAKSDNALTLDNAAFCSLSNATKFALNSTVTIKGRCIGYDDLLEEIKLDQCTLIN
ncbi:OB-fold protein [Lacinutrix jangbogonensis]|uniref:OB-fold protein n=1 Tax=Lacinutrix jangbogonensis TaxID=1469557 RepID=UPI00053EB3FA|nr:hypothetical protein [Lacinutrix jangbogonensis]